MGYDDKIIVLEVLNTLKDRHPGTLEMILVTMDLADEEFEKVIKRLNKETG